MHELAFAAVPAIGLPLLAARTWWARRRARRLGAVTIGERVPEWGVLVGTDGTHWGPKDVAAAPAMVFVFMSNRCPGVKAYDGRLNALAARWRARGILLLGVNSVPAHLYPSEARQHMAAAARARGLGFPYVKDEAQTLQRVLGAVCTPQAFVLDRQGRLRYRGRIDDAFLEDRVRSHDLADAVEAVADGREPARTETHAIGCALDAPMGLLSRRQRRGIRSRAGAHA